MKRDINKIYTCSVCNLDKLGVNFISKKGIILHRCQSCVVIIKKELQRQKNIRQKDLQKKWRIDNKERLYMQLKNKMETDPLFKLKRHMRSLVCDSFRKRYTVKDLKTSQIIGCDFETLKCHIESKFKLGMSWDNRNEWHIDHKIPLKVAKTKEDIIKLNHYTNLQPLWAIDNLKKGATHG